MLWTEQIPEGSSLDYHEGLMLPKKRIPIHPGVILRDEFLEDLGVSQVAFAEHLGIPFQHVNEIILGKRGVTSETAWLLAGALGTTPEFWLNIQVARDLVASRPAKLVRRIKPAGRR